MGEKKTRAKNSPSVFARVAKLAFCHRGPGDIAVFGTSGESTSTRLFGASDEKYQKKREVEFENRKTVAENRCEQTVPLLFYSSNF